MAEETYLVPRQVTSRFEFVPGWGIPEAIGLVSGLAVGSGLYQVAARLGLPQQLGVVAVVTVTMVAIGIVKGVKPIIRWIIFAFEPKRFLYRTGTGQGKPILSASYLKGGDFQVLAAVMALMVKPKPKAAKRSPAAQAVQDWLPVSDVPGDYIARKDGMLVAAIRIEPVNLSLKSSAEQARIMGGLHEAINALQSPAQILSMARPLDLNTYVSSLEERLTEVDANRQRLLRPYLRYVSGLLTSGETHERRFYMLLPHPTAKGGPEELRHQANEVLARLRLADLDASLLNDTELIDLLFVWSHPMQAAFERTPVGPPAMTTLMGG